ncbi:hypothetical protein [Aneurinibacillus aneurinilyticus]|uniref:hypothetical protein n=1 Tax=Aneurinibacillus aneurinilyticus TaxID=1391 RepID=UPI0012DBE9A3|nr:hypothetical protein [Aneurinibacillus aneurinilyticus]
MFYGISSDLLRDLESKGYNCKGYNCKASRVLIIQYNPEWIVITPCPKRASVRLPHRSVENGRRFVSRTEA